MEPLSNNYWDKMMGDDDHAATYMQTYDEGPGSPLRHFIGNFINDGESVPDVGCGPGWNYDHFQENGPRVDYTGMDYSERFIRVAKDRQPGGKWIVEDARKLPLDITYDVVIMQDVLEYVPDYKKPMHDAVKIANKRIIVTFWHLVEDQESEHVNPPEIPEEDDGHGAWWARPSWEKFLDSLNIHWVAERIPRREGAFAEQVWHDIYIIDKQEDHGNISRTKTAPHGGGDSDATS